MLQPAFSPFTHNRLYQSGHWTHFVRVLIEQCYIITDQTWSLILFEMQLCARRLLINQLLAKFAPLVKPPWNLLRAKSDWLLANVHGIIDISPDCFFLNEQGVIRSNNHTNQREMCKEMHSTLAHSWTEVCGSFYSMFIRTELVKDNTRTLIRSTGPFNLPIFHASLSTLIIVCNLIIICTYMGFFLVRLSLSVCVHGITSIQLKRVRHGRSRSRQMTT